MSDMIREATERQRAVRSGAKTHKELYGHDRSDPLGGYDEGILLDAYLAEHPADEAWPNLANESRERLYRKCVAAGVNPDGKWLSEAACEAIDKYLAEHPADDGEPVTAGWLLSQGFEIDDEGYAELSDIMLARFLGHEWAIYIDGCCGPSPLTRGHVRKFAAALGVGLKEKP